MDPSPMMDPYTPHIPIQPVPEIRDIRVQVKRLPSAFNACIQQAQARQREREEREAMQSAIHRPQNPKNYARARIPKKTYGNTDGHGKKDMKKKKDGKK